MTMCKFISMSESAPYTCTIYKDRCTGRFILCYGRPLACMGRGDEIYDIRRDKEAKDAKS